MKDIIVLKDDHTGLSIAWEKNNIEAKYNILGKTNHFYDQLICTTNDNKIFLNESKIKDFIGITIEYLIDDNTVLERTNTYVIKKEKENYKDLKIKAMESYHGITLSYATKEIYDRYYIYEKENDKYHKILETDDFQITSDLFKEGNIYKIEAYLKDSNNLFQLEALIEDYTLKIDPYIESKEKPKVSIIVPIYNCEFLLPRTLDSILFSTLKEIEVILINDGSTDHTQEIINWYQKRCPNIIKTITTENQLVVKSRNLGLTYATAPYTFFMDHDDLIHPNMLEIMINCAQETDSDFVMNKTIVRDNFDVSYIYFYNIDDPENKKRYITKTYEEFMDNNRFETLDNFFLITPWQHIGKTSIYKKVPVPDYKRYEDYAHAKSLFSYGNKISFCMDAYYVWEKRIKNIRDTLTDKTEKELSQVEKINMYVDALFQFVHDGNPDRFDIMMRNAINDVYELCKETIDNVFIKKQKYRGDNLYVQRIYEYIMKYEVYNIPLIRNDRKLFTYVKAIMIIMINFLKEQEKESN